MTGIEKISFGNGGGFTGKVIIYELTSDCKLFKEGQNPKRIKSKKTAELFNLAKEFNNIEFNEPGNLYSFINIKTKEKINRIVWTYGSKEVNHNIIKLHNELFSITK